MITNRIDFVDVNLWEEGSTIETSFKKTAEGYLEGRAIVSNVGVFTYVLPDGTIQRELRPPAEVFAEDSINSLKLKPLTNDHPAEKVTAENIKKYQIGFSGDQVFKDEYYLSIPISITDSDAILEVDNGKRAFSCGYSVDIEYKAGTWCGVDYDAVQRNIRYNHIALVDRGRAGDKARMKLDASENIGVQLKNDSINTEYKNYNGGANMAQTIKIDGVDYEVDKDVKKHIHVLDTKLDTIEKESKAEIEKLKKDNSELQAKCDQFEDEKLDLQKQIEDAKKIEKDVLDSAVKSRMVVLSASDIAGVELKGDEDDLTIKKEIIKKLYPASSEKIDKADSVYIEARFDVALEKIAELKKDSKEVSEILKNDSATQNNDAGEKTIEQARKDMQDYFLNLYKTNDSEGK